MGLDTVELVIRFEQAFGIVIPDEVAANSPHSFKKEWTREEVAQLVRQIVIDETGVENFTDDSRFVQDLHLD